MVFITLPLPPYLKLKCPQTQQSGSYLAVKIADNLALTVT